MRRISISTPSPTRPNDIPIVFEDEHLGWDDSWHLRELSVVEYDAASAYAEKMIEQYESGRIMRPVFSGRTIPVIGPVVRACWAVHMASPSTRADGENQYTPIELLVMAHASESVYTAVMQASEAVSPEMVKKAIAGILKEMNRPMGGEIAAADDSDEGDEGFLALAQE